MLLGVGLEGRSSEASFRNVQRVICNCEAIVFDGCL
jgi:hypothetical protein